MYIVKKPYSDNPNLVTRLQGETIGLNGEVRVIVLPSKKGNGFERVIRAANQADLKLLFESGNPLIIWVEYLEEVGPLEETGSFEKKEKRKKEKQEKQDE